MRLKTPEKSNSTNSATRKVKRQRTKSKYYAKWHTSRTNYHRIWAVKTGNQVKMLLALMEASSVNKLTSLTMLGSAMRLNRNKRQYQEKVLYGQDKSIGASLELNVHP